MIERRPLSLCVLELPPTRHSHPRHFDEPDRGRRPSVILVSHRARALSPANWPPSRRPLERDKKREGAAQREERRESARARASHTTKHGKGMRIRDPLGGLLQTGSPYSVGGKRELGLVSPEKYALC